MSQIITGVHLAPSVSRFGLLGSVGHLLHNVPQDIYKPTVIGLHDSRTERDLSWWDPIPIRTHGVRGPEQFGYAPGLLDDLLASNPDMVHMHGLWKYPSIAALRWARRTGRPYIISVHGMLEPWALNQSRLVKRLALWLYQRACLEGAACIQCTAASEVQSVRNAGYRNPIALVKIGVKVPNVLPPRPSPGERQPRKVLFLSRIHPKKGLLNLVNAWNQIRPRQWQLAIVGPDEGGHLSEVQRLVKKCHLEDQVLFFAEAVGEEKLRHYTEAELFVLPTFSENFGAVIGEALGCGVPVITTRGAPWETLEKFRCGWWVDIGVEPLVAALTQAFSLPIEELRAMGLRGRRFVQEEHSWKAIGEDMAEVYRWVTGRRDSAPPVIIL